MGLWRSLTLPTFSVSKLQPSLGFHRCPCPCPTLPSVTHQSLYVPLSWSLSPCLKSLSDARVPLHSVLPGLFRWHRDGLSCCYNKCLNTHFTLTIISMADTVLFRDWQLFSFFLVTKSWFCSSFWGSKSQPRGVNQDWCHLFASDYLGRWLWHNPVGKESARVFDIIQWERNLLGYLGEGLKTPHS